MTRWGGRALPLRLERGADGRVVERYVERPSGLCDMLAAAVAARGDHPALVFEDLRWTWREFAAAVAGLAGGLRQAGVNGGDRVALLSENSASFVLITFAIAHVGAILVPISGREQRPGVTHIVNDSAASILVFQESLLAAVPEGAKAPGLRLCIAIESAAFEALRKANAVPAVLELEDAVAAILYTSGTTGAAKGVKLSHGSIVHSSLSFVSTMQLGATDISVAAVPFSHVTGLVAMIGSIVCAKGTLIVMRHFSARYFLELAERERMTHTVMVPAMYNLCLSSSDFDGRDLSSWGVAGFGGAQMALPTIDRLRIAAPGLRLMNIYGATETTSPAVIMPSEYASSRREAVGVPAPGCRIIVMDENDREVPNGESGEIWVRGAMVTSGYWSPIQGNPDFCDGYWRSGDIGSIADDGFVTIHDRKKDMINRGGYKIFPAEIESDLMAFPGVIEAAVIGRPCDVLGERVHAVIVVGKDGELPDYEPMREMIATTFSDYKIPETWDIRSEPLPRNANGKVQKQVLRSALNSYRHGDAR